MIMATSTLINKEMRVEPVDVTVSSVVAGNNSDVLTADLTKSDHVPIGVMGING